MKTLESVVDYWFEKENDYQKWFFAGKSLDEKIRQDYGELLEKVGNNEVVPNSDKELLGVIILFDQFSRHINRGSEKAFIYDILAQELTIGLLSSEDIEKYTTIQKLFILMPLQHSEKVEDKGVILDYLDKVQKDNTDEKDLAIYNQLREHTVKHKEVLEKFGRYPKRNLALGRESTKEELEYIRTTRNPY